LRDTQVARDALDVSDLIARRRTARTVPTVEVPPPLLQLQHAVPNGSDTGHSSPGTGAARSPLTLTAPDVVSEIAAATGFRGPASSPNLAAHLAAWCVKVCGDETQVVHAAQLAAGWPDRARAVLDPVKHRTMPGACPGCGNRVAYTHRDGEVVRAPAIALDTTSRPTTARCLRCPARWVGEAQLQQLNRVLNEEARS